MFIQIYAAIFDLTSLQSVLTTNPLCYINTGQRGWAQKDRARRVAESGWRNMLVQTQSRKLNKIMETDG